MAHILLIEGNAELRADVQKALERDGHSVEAVGNSDDARNSVTMRIPALLISDQKLGEEYVDFLNELTRNRKLSRIPVILMVGSDDLSGALSSYECDIFAILKKPVDLDHLRIQVETVLRQTQRQKQSRKRERRSCAARSCASSAKCAPPRKT
ncbi:MAG: response regulator [Planctomycetes bacterium]|nr:response regulator [Planctomycetota bacterium]